MGRICVCLHHWAEKIALAVEVTLHKVPQVRTSLGAVKFSVWQLLLASLVRICKYLSHALQAICAFVLLSWRVGPSFQQLLKIRSRLDGSTHVCSHLSLTCVPTCVSSVIGSAPPHTLYMQINVDVSTCKDQKPCCFRVPMGAMHFTFGHFTQKYNHIICALQWHVISLHPFGSLKKQGLCFLYLQCTLVRLLF